MLQELATQTGAAAWAIGSMLFFLAVFVAVVVWVVLKRPEEMQARARMALEGDSEDSGFRILDSGVRSQESGITIEDAGAARRASGQRDSVTPRIPNPES